MATSIKRLAKEYELQKTTLAQPGVELKPVGEGKPLEWVLRIQAPPTYVLPGQGESESPYKGKLFEVSVKCNDLYPHKAPVVSGGGGGTSGEALLPTPTLPWDCGALFLLLCFLAPSAASLTHARSSSFYSFYSPLSLLLLAHFPPPPSHPHWAGGGLHPGHLFPPPSKHGERGGVQEPV